MYFDCDDINLKLSNYINAHLAERTRSFLIKMTIYIILSTWIIYYRYESRMNEQYIYKAISIKKWNIVDRDLQGQLGGHDASEDGHEFICFLFCWNKPDHQLNPLSIMIWWRDDMN